MTPERYKVVSDEIESICEQGCSQINKLLDKAKSENGIPALSTFSHREVSVIIKELSEIMAVYENTHESEPDVPCENNRIDKK